MATSLGDLTSGWKRVRGALAKDPLFKKLGGARSLPRIHALLASPPKSWEKLFDTLCEMEPSDRWAGLALAATTVPRAKTRIGKTMRVRSGAKVLVGDVTIAGDLVLGGQAVVVATGDLTVEGNVVGDFADFSLIASGGTLRARGLYSAGEVLARKAIAIAGSAWLSGNDYVAVAPKMTAKTLVHEGRDDRFGRIAVTKRWAKTLSSAADVEKVATSVGLPGFTDAGALEDAFRKLLITGKASAPPERVSGDPQKELVDAAIGRDIKRAQAALDAGATARGPNGAEALKIAIYNDAVDVVKLLLAAGADPNARDQYGNTPLMAAEWRLPVSKALVAAGADVNARDERSRTTALHKAYENPASLAFLLSSGADPAALDGFGRTALHLVVQAGDGPSVAPLVRGGAPLEARNNDGETPLFVGCARGWLPVVKPLLAAGADVNTTDLQGRTPLMAAATVKAEVNLVPLIRALLAAGARADARDREGRTAAQLAQVAAVKAALSH